MDTRLLKIHESLKKVDINTDGLRFGSAHAHHRREADLDEISRAFYDRAGMFGHQNLCLIGVFR